MNLILWYFAPFYFLSWICYPGVVNGLFITINGAGGFDFVLYSPALRESFCWAGIVVGVFMDAHFLCVSIGTFFVL